MICAHFEISIDGKPRTYRNTKEEADQAVALLKKQNPNSDIVARDLHSHRAGSSPPQ
jgi:hypothetical protein